MIAYGRRGRKKIDPGSKLRVLIVDDSVVIRRLVKHALEQDPHIEVIGAAANGNIALRMIAASKPDAITLDVEMPEMNGLETLKAIRQNNHDLVVIMFSTLSERGAAITMEALSLGADDYVTKAANIGSLDRSLIRLRDELVPKLQQFFVFGDESSKRATATTASQKITSAAFSKSLPAKKITCQAVVIGVSTGGPNALAQLIPMFPADFRLPVLIVQHMPPVFTRLLAERLQKLTSLCVKEAADGTSIEGNCIYIAPGNFHMRAIRQGAASVLKLDQAAPENSCRPAVDVLFRSAAELYGGQVIATILTGMGQDGLRGVEQLKARGAYVIAQDEASSVVWGMPGSVAKAGLADAVLPLHDVVPTIQKILQ